MEVDKGEKQKYYSKKHSCKTCGKTFPFKSKLITHEMIHTGDQPYKCYFCEKTFNRRSPLVDHLRIHTGHQPYECDNCELNFTNSNALQQHKSVCYRCNICEMTFSQKRHMKVFIQMKSNMNVIIVERLSLLVQILKSTRRLIQVKSLMNVNYVT